MGKPYGVIQRPQTLEEGPHEPSSGKQYSGEKEHVKKKETSARENLLLEQAFFSKR